MNTYVRVPITVVVVDSGPVISLAVCGRLDLLRSFSRPVRIADVARAECVRDLEKLGAANDRPGVVGRNTKSTWTDTLEIGASSEPPR